MIQITEHLVGNRLSAIRMYSRLDDNAGDKATELVVTRHNSTGIMQHKIYSV